MKTFKQLIEEINDAPYTPPRFQRAEGPSAPIIFGKRVSYPTIAKPLAAFFGGLIGSGIAKTAANAIAPEYASAASLAGMALGGIGSYRWARRVMSGEDVDYMEDEYRLAVKNKESTPKLDYLYNQYEKAVHAHNAITPFPGKKIYTSYGRFTTNDKRRLMPKLHEERNMENMSKTYLQYLREIRNLRENDNVIRVIHPNDKKSIEDAEKQEAIEREHREFVSKERERVRGGWTRPDGIKNNHIKHTVFHHDGEVHIQTNLKTGERKKWHVSVPLSTKKQAHDQTVKKVGEGLGSYQVTHVTKHKDHFTTYVHRIRPDGSVHSAGKLIRTNKHTGETTVHDAY